MERQEKLKRIIARGEHSNHAHVLVGEIEFLENCYKVPSSPNYTKAVALYEAMIEEKKEAKTKLSKQYGDTLLNEDTFKKFREEVRQAFYEINIPYNKGIEELKVPTLRHVFESNFLDTEEYIWTKEHPHTPMKEGTYKYSPQYEEHPYLGIVKVQD